MTDPETKKLIMSILDSLEMEENFRDIESSEDLHEYQLRRNGFNTAKKQQNSRIEEAKKQYE